ncbi:hypothetical protein PHMEG_0005464 [Phytophthora megakarya]|uniref:Uncharacterized protein n=1 Tax=Phytophthora megakarya TaxID=4795 RepID=A0A225WRF5_9STRA|nr:hypothetical protein PHMEG_0005464 [Phytophthora megakarya]
METFRCELPNLIALTSEEYPLAAIFIRDCCCKALMSVSERNFNAGLAWYLLDCKVVAKTIERMTNYALATITTIQTADRALRLCIISTSNQSPHASSTTGIDNSAAEAAVSEALGLTRSGGISSDRGETSSPISPVSVLSNGEPDDGELEPLTASSEIFCLPTYDIRVGLRSVAYILERTYRFTLVLLDEFQISGGYALLLRLLDTCSEEEIPSLLDILMSLMPLGGRSSDSSETVERSNILGARNVHAFSTIRDLLLNYIAGSNSDTTVELSGETQCRNEHLILQLLTQVLHIYTSDYDNFVCLEPKTRTLALLLTKLPYISFFDAKVIILRIVEYVSCAAKPDDPLPHDILSVVCGLLIAYDPLTRSIDSNDVCADIVDPTAVLIPEILLRATEEEPTSTLSTLICECLIKVLRNSEANRYKHELSGFGLMDRGIYLWFGRVTACLTSVPETDMAMRHKILAVLKTHLNLFGDLMCSMLRHNPQECIRFRQGPMPNYLYAITDVLIVSDVLTTPFDMSIEQQICTNGVFSIFTELANLLRYTDNHECDAQVSSRVSSGVESDLIFMLELLQRFRGTLWRQMVVVCILMDMLKVGGLAIVPLWKSCQGYEILIALLSSLDLIESESPERVYQMMELLLQTLNLTLSSQCDGNSNVDYFKSIQGFSTVASCILTSGVIESTKRKAVLQRVFELISGDALQNEIRNGDAVQIIFRLLPDLPTIDAVESMTKLLSMFGCSTSASIVSNKAQAVNLINAGALEWINEPRLIAKLLQADDPLNRLLTEWIATVALEEDLRIPRLHDFLGLIGKTMPMLLSNQISVSKGIPGMGIVVETPETGLLFLQRVLRNPTIRHIPVGKTQSAGLMFLKVYRGWGML